MNVMIQGAYARPPTPSFMKRCIEWIEGFTHDQTLNNLAINEANSQTLVHTINKPFHESNTQALSEAIKHNRSINQAWTVRRKRFPQNEGNTANRTNIRERMEE